MPKKLNYYDGYKKRKQPCWNNLGTIARNTNPDVLELDQLKKTTDIFIFISMTIRDTKVE